MPAYVIADIDVHDTQKFEEYKSLAPGSLADYCGRYIVRGGRVETLEGTWSPKRLVIIEFPSVAQAKAWWDSPAYTSAKAIRKDACRAQFIVTEGLGEFGGEFGGR